MHAAAQLSAYTARDTSQGYGATHNGWVVPPKPKQANPPQACQEAHLSGDFHILQLGTITEGEEMKARIHHSSPLKFILQAQLSSTKEKGCTQGIGAVTRDTQESGLPHIQG